MKTKYYLECEVIDGKIVIASRGRDVIVPDGNFGVGTDDPDARTHIKTNGMPLILERVTNSVPGANIQQYKARGTVASPQAVLGGDVLGGNAGFGYDGENYIVAANFLSAIESIDADNVRGMFIWRVRSGGKAPGMPERMRLTSDGKLRINILEGEGHRSIFADDDGALYAIDKSFQSLKIDDVGAGVGVTTMDCEAGMNFAVPVNSAEYHDITITVTNLASGMSGKVLLNIAGGGNPDVAFNAGGQEGDSLLDIDDGLYIINWFYDGDIFRYSIANKDIGGIYDGNEPGDMLVWDGSEWLLTSSLYESLTLISGQESYAEWDCAGYKLNKKINATEAFTLKINDMVNGQSGHLVISVISSPITMSLQFIGEVPDAVLGNGTLTNLSGVNNFCWAYDGNTFTWNIARYDDTF